MYDDGWVGITWPKEDGGQGAGLLEQVIFDEEYSNAHAPILPSDCGIALCGPTVMHWGTEEQKERFLNRIRNGDDFVINGQKVWT